MWGKTMTEHNHVNVRLLFCVYDVSTLKYHVKTYYYCNTCAEKIYPMTEETFDNIPNNHHDGTITKVICNVMCNGREYEWFGHMEDRDFYIKHGDKW